MKNLQYRGSEHGNARRERVVRSKNREKRGQSSKVSQEKENFRVKKIESDFL